VTAINPYAASRSIPAMMASSFASFGMVFAVEARVAFGQHVPEKRSPRSFLVLHEAMVSRQCHESAVPHALGMERNGGASSGETAADCAGAVVWNGYLRRLVRCQARRLRVVRHREYRNAGLEPRGGTRRNGFER
jgi:hypothetical protein